MTIKVWIFTPGHKTVSPHVFIEYFLKYPGYSRAFNIFQVYQYLTYLQVVLFIKI